MTTTMTQNRIYHTNHTAGRSTRIRRQNIVHRQKCILLTTAILLFVLTYVFFGSSLLALAKSNTAATHTAYKYYTSIQLEEGDSLWSIAEEYASLGYRNYEEYINEVIFLNHLEDDTIHAGQYLTVPYFSYNYK